MPKSASIVGIARGMPVKSCLSANPAYAKYEPPTVTRKLSDGSAASASQHDSFEDHSHHTGVSSASSSTSSTHTRNSSSSSKSHRSSVIGIDTGPVLEQNDREILHYAHILPRYDRATKVPEPAYLQMLVPPPPKATAKAHAHPHRRSLEEQYEFVAGPMPPYENTEGRERLEVLGFSSLRRDGGRAGQQRRNMNKVNNNNNCHTIDRISSIRL